MMTFLNRVPVFPGEFEGDTHHGITLRAYIATAVLPAICKGKDPLDSAELAVEYADALLRELWS